MKDIAYVPILLLSFAACSDQNTLSGSSNAPHPEYDPRPIILSTPELSLGIGIETGDFILSWTSSSGATHYTLQSDTSPEITNPTIMYSGPNNTWYLGFESDYTLTYYYRLRAESPNTRSTWSDAIQFPR